MSENKPHRFDTRVIHGGQQPDPLTGAVVPPIYATSTYVQASPGVHKGYEYSRTANPTRDALQNSLADLEGGAAGFAFASGLAATATILDLLDSGSHIVAMHDLYGGSYRLFENVRKRSAGLNVSFVDLTDTAALDASLQPNTRMIWVETPTNPLLDIVDLSGIAAVAKRRGIMTVCDNTFATPVNFRPLERGFDLVLANKVPLSCEQQRQPSVIGRSSSLRAYGPGAVGPMTAVIGECPAGLVHRSSCGSDAVRPACRAAGIPAVRRGNRLAALARTDTFHERGSNPAARAVEL